MNAAQKWSGSIPQKVQDAIATIQAVRRPSDMESTGIDYMDVFIRNGKRLYEKDLEFLKPMFIEEPVLSENSEHSSTWRSIPARRSHGERLFSRWISNRCLPREQSILFSLTSAMRRDIRNERIAAMAERTMLLLRLISTGSNLICVQHYKSTLVASMHSFRRPVWHSYKEGADLLTI